MVYFVEVVLHALEDAPVRPAPGAPGSEDAPTGPRAGDAARALPAATGAGEQAAGGTGFSMERLRKVTHLPQSNRAPYSLCCADAGDPAPATRHYLCHAPDSQWRAHISVRVCASRPDNDRAMSGCYHACAVQLRVVVSE